MFPGLVTFGNMAGKSFLVCPVHLWECFLVCPPLAIGNNVSWFVHLREKWLGNVSLIGLSTFGKDG
jgi:hypothetical protein